MADIELDSLVVRDFTEASSEVFKQAVESGEIGENDLSFTPFMPASIPVLTPMWFDHIANDVSWLRADTFSWHSGDKYKAAYEHLAGEFPTGENATIELSDGTILTRNASADKDGYLAWTNSEFAITPYTDGLPKIGRNLLAWNSQEERYVANPSWVISGGTYVFNSDTIGDITIIYYQAKDRHKICMPDQESNLVALYESTGVARYYILDTANKQFKLPREKPMSGMVVGNGELGIINANVSNPASATVSTVWQSGASGNPLVLANTSIASAGTTLGVSGDGKKSGLAVERTSDNRYLYFYVGNFEQDAVEQTAGLNAEMFNGKADRNLLNTTDNVDIVVESQLPTEANGHTWYRKYKSGWVEQGGSALGEGPRTATFPVPMADTNYNVMAVANRSNADAITGVSYTTKTTTSVNFAVSNINKEAYTWNSSNGIRWEVKGMAA